MMNKKFSFIEAPIYQGQKKFGVSLGPAFLKQQLLDQKFNFKVLSLQASQSFEQVNFEAYEELSYHVERELRRNKFPFISGGDHSLSIGSIQGVLRVNPDVKVLWIDAHGDINTRQTSLTKSFHGMPLSFLLGLDNYLTSTGWFDEKLMPENLIYVGLRDLDSAEEAILKKYNIKYFTANEFKSEKQDEIIAEIKLCFQNHDIHVSLDADAFDPAIAPATGVPVQNGLCFESVAKLMKCISQTSNIISYEFVELNPQIFNKPEDVFLTAALGINIFKTILENHNCKHNHNNQHQEGFYDVFDRYGSTKKFEEESNLLYSHF